MYWFKNKIIYSIFIVFIISLIFPFFSFATDKTSFVWSDVSKPTIETVSSLTQDKR